MPQAHHDLIDQFLRGAINRRTFIRRAVAAGLGASAVAGLLATVPAGAFAQEAGLPEPTPLRADGTPASDDLQVLKMATPSPFRMDPPTYGGDLWQLQLMVFQGLTRIDYENVLGPGLADTWESNEDKTVWTFHLNPNAMFSDGTPITGDDVKWTWSWIANPLAKAVSPDTFKNVVGYADVASGAAELLSGIEVPDPQTVVITLATTDPALPARAGTIPGCILKKDNVISGGEEWWRTPVTSGIFKVTEYTPGDQATMTLERNEHWCRDAAKLARIEISLIADPQTQLVQYDNSELNGIVCQPAEFAQATKEGGDRSTDLFWGYAPATWYFGFFCEKAPFDDVNVRRAFAQAIDLNVLSSAVLSGIYPPQPRVIPADFPCGGLEQWQPTFDPEAAKASLAASTYGGPDGLGKVTILISEQGGATALGTWAKVATAMQPMLKDNLGVDIELVRKVFSNVPEQQAEARAIEGGAIFRLSFGATILDPSYIYNNVYSTSSGNAPLYNNPEVDALLDQAGAELDEAKRCELYTQVDKIISEDAVFLAPFRGTSTWFFKPEVRGMKIVNQRVWNSIDKIYIAAE
ncbi:ABC transporter substrate-binding protein [soil metagenome]